MLTLLLTVAVVSVPFLGTVGLLLLATGWQRRRDTRVARQIAVTEAIHRELGAVVAPSMTGGAYGRPRLVIPVALERPNLVAAVLAIAHRVLRGWDAAGARTEIVLVPRVEVEGTANWPRRAGETAIGAPRAAETPFVSRRAA
jgi:hypothetical protein